MPLFRRSYLIDKTTKETDRMHTIAIEEGLSYIITPNLTHATLFTQQFEILISNQ